MARSAADRARDYRERKRQERAAETKVERDVRDAAARTTMRDAVEDALSHMKWLVASDAASIAQARDLAEDIDLLKHDGQREKALSAHRALSRVLNDLGGTPSVRLARELRSAKHMPEAGVDDDGKQPAEGQAAGNVSRFQRPAKRGA